MRVSDLPDHPHYRITAAADTTLASLSSTLRPAEPSAAEEEAAESAVAEPAE
jgi:hypothetical protein